MRTSVELVYTTTPYEHQREALEIAWGQPNFAYFLEMGTGKSKIVVDETINLIERDLINCVVVVAPNGVHEAWADQYELHGAFNRSKYEIQIYKAKKTDKQRKDQEQVTRDIINSGKVLVFLINIEALSLPSGQNYVGKILRARNKTYLVVDESHKIKSGAASRTKFLTKVGVFARYRRIATGTEAQEGLEDLYSQFRFMDWQIIGHKYFTSFRGMYCVMGGFEQRNIVGYINREHLAAQIAPYTYQKRKHECLDLPDKVYVEHHVEMTPEQSDMYDKLENELLVELDDNTLVDTTMMLTRLIRLQQVLCGHLSSEESKVYFPNNRAPYVCDLVESASGKVIVFCRFVADTYIVAKELVKNGMGCIIVTGETDKRLEAINTWRNDPNIRVLAITTQTGGTGLTLNEASTTIFYSNHWSSTDRLQAEDRNHRIGQEQKVTYHDITVRGKIDARILKALKAKKTFAEDFRSLLAQGKASVVRNYLYGDNDEGE